MRTKQSEDNNRLIIIISKPLGMKYQWAIKIIITTTGAAAAATTTT